VEQATIFAPRLGAVKIDDFYVEDLYSKLLSTFDLNRQFKFSSSKSFVHP